ncbi:MAG: hypothetical protein R2831_00160 [Chitinophagaceae bacterium]
MSVGSIDVDCYNNATGSLTATAIGSTGTINYSIQPGTSNNTSGQFTTLTATSYTIIATDAVGCSTATTIVINQPDSLTLSSSATPILCNGGNSTLTVTAGGGTTPYSYAINGGTYQGSNSFTGITQGSYTITVKDANNCTKTTTINITQPSALTLSSSATPILCNGGNSTLTATAGGGTTPYSYAINGGTYQSSNSFTGITQGSYTITVKDANNCTKTTTINISQPTALAITTLTATIPSCVPGNDATITTTASGGTSPYSYSLNGGVYQSTSQFINQGVGNYTITVKDANNCTVSSTISVITPNSPSFVSVSSIDVDCYNNATGSLTATAIGGTGTINYSIQPGTSNNTSGQFTTLTATSYTIIATDAVGCSTATTIVINQPDSLTAWSATPILCNGGNSTLTATAGGGTTPYSYAINGGTYQSSNSFTGITQGSYTITVKDANNCTKTTTINTTQPSGPYPKFGVLLQYYAMEAIAR